MSELIDFYPPWNHSKIYSFSGDFRDVRSWLFARICLIWEIKCSNDPEISFMRFFVRKLCVNLILGKCSYWLAMLASCSFVKTTELNLEMSNHGHINIQNINSQFTVKLHQNDIISWQKLKYFDQFALLFFLVTLFRVGFFIRSLPCGS